MQKYNVKEKNKAVFNLTLKILTNLFFSRISDVTFFLSLCIELIDTFRWSRNQGVISQVNMVHGFTGDISPSFYLFTIFFFVLRQTNKNGILVCFFFFKSKGGNPIIRRLQTFLFIFCIYFLGCILVHFISSILGLSILYWTIRTVFFLYQNLCVYIVHTHTSFGKQIKKKKKKTTYDPAEIIFPPVSSGKYLVGCSNKVLNKALRGFLWPLNTYVSIFFLLEGCTS